MSGAYAACEPIVGISPSPTGDHDAARLIALRTKTSQAQFLDGSASQMSTTDNGDTGMWLPFGPFYRSLGRSPGALIARGVSDSGDSEALQAVECTPFR
jgi:hypothetical protein